MKKLSIATMALLGVAGSSFAQLTIDGTKDAEYTPTTVFQTNGTQFGDSNLGQVGAANGSELNGAYGYVSGGYYNLFVPGNLESNYNKFELFIDSIAGGQNQLRGDNPDVSFNGLNRMGNDGSGNGLKFDTGFDADFYFSIAMDSGAIYGNFAELLTSGGGTGYYLGSVTPGVAGAPSGGTNPAGILFNVNNSNTLGATSGAAASSGAVDLIATGVEFAIPLSLLGLTDSNWHTNGFKVAAFINGSSHDFISNQVLGGLPVGTGNIGDPRNVDFNQFAGNQYFVVPEPASMVMLSLGLAGLVARKRRK